MIVSEKGLGKCTLIKEFSTQLRGGKGVKCYKITEKTGNLIGVKSVHEDDEIMLITTEGIIIRIRVKDTTLLGRVTSGVKLMNLDEDVTVASVARVVEDKSLMPPEESEESTEDKKDSTEALEADGANSQKVETVENSEDGKNESEEIVEAAEAGLSNSESNLMEDVADAVEAVEFVKKHDIDGSLDKLLERAEEDKKEDNE